MHIFAQAAIFHWTNMEYEMNTCALMQWHLFISHEAVQVPKYGRYVCYGKLKRLCYYGNLCQGEACMPLMCSHTYM